MDCDNQNIGYVYLIYRNLEGCGFSNLDIGSSCHSSSSMIALLVVWSDYLSIYKNLKNFRGRLRYVKN